MKKKPVNLNLGCGTNIVKDWINVDDYCLPNGENKDFVRADIRNLPFEKNFADYVLMDQVLEHVPMYDIPTVLHELRRVMKVGGKAVICVPDFRSAAQDWLELDHDAGFNPFLYKYLSEVIYGNQNHQGEFHVSPMSAGFLHYVLCMVGLDDHKLTLYVKFAPGPAFPGMREAKGAKSRNGQLVAEITKTK